VASFLVALALLVVAAFLIALPAFGAPDAGDVCNAPTFEERDELRDEKNGRAKIMLAGAAMSLLAAVVAFVAAAAKREWRGRMLLVVLIGVAGSALGFVVAFLTALIVC
jgi:MFS family permease